jgi:hypothetical protein
MVTLTSSAESPDQNVGTGASLGEIHGEIHSEIRGEIRGELYFLPAQAGSW